MPSVVVFRAPTRLAFDLSAFLCVSRTRNFEHTWGGFLGRGDEGRPGTGRGSKAVVEGDLNDFSLLGEVLCFR